MAFGKVPPEFEANLPQYEADDGLELKVWKDVLCANPSHDR